VFSPVSDIFTFIETGFIQARYELIVMRAAISEHQSSYTLPLLLSFNTLETHFLLDINAQ